MISKGTFDDIYVGDYIVANGVTWLIADIDTYLYTGDQGNGLEKHNSILHFVFSFKSVSFKLHEL